MRCRMLLAALGVVWVAAFGLPLAAEEVSWPEIPASEKQLTEVPGLAGAPAVVLLSRAELVVDEAGRSNYVDVYRRLKVLTQEGRDAANGVLQTSRWWRVRSLEARTHLPDGKIVPLAADEVFKEAFSESKKQRLSFALPQVEPGSILEMRWREYFDGRYFAHTWHFQESLPVLRSEYIVDRPKSINIAPYPRMVAGHQLQQSRENTPSRVRMTFALEDLPGIPQEILSFPLEDLSSSLTVLSHETLVGGDVYPLLEDWDEAITLFQGTVDYGYRSARRGDGAAKAKAKQLVAGDRKPRSRAETVFRFVRDEIEHEGSYGTRFLDTSLDKVLKQRTGDGSEQALLLQAMLDAIGVSSAIVWGKSRDRGRVQDDVPNPWQFSQVLVAAQVEGKRVFLDPSDPNLAFGFLDAHLEGTKALIVDGKKPEWVVLPASVPEDNQSLLTMALTLREDQGVAGTGELIFTGHEAWARFDRGRSAEASRTRWLEWLEKRFSNYRVSGIELVENVDARSVEVRWDMTQRDEARQEDEVLFRPWAQTGFYSVNLFSTDPNRRLLPVQLDYPVRDVVKLSLHWPEGWELEVEPPPTAKVNEVGALMATSRVDPQARQLHIERSLSIDQIELLGRQAYSRLYELFQAKQVHDAEPLILVKR